MVTWTRVALVEVEAVRSGWLWGTCKGYSQWDHQQIGWGHVTERPEAAMRACANWKVSCFSFKWRRWQSKWVLREDQFGFGNVKFETPLGHLRADLRKQLATQGRGQESGQADWR